MWGPQNRTLDPSQTLRVLAMFSDAVLVWNGGSLSSVLPGQAYWREPACPFFSTVVSECELGDSGLPSWKGTEMTSFFISLLRLFLALHLLCLSAGFILDEGTSVTLRRLLVPFVPGSWVPRLPVFLGLSVREGLRVCFQQWTTCHYPLGFSFLCLQR